jgi:hypothetical protein
MATHHKLNTGATSMYSLDQFISFPSHFISSEGLFYFTLKGCFSLDQVIHTDSEISTVPAVGFGTWQDKDDQEKAVAAALAAGYRHIDTASSSLALLPAQRIR